MIHPLAQAKKVNNAFWQDLQFVLIWQKKETWHSAYIGTSSSRTNVPRMVIFERHVAFEKQNCKTPGKTLGKKIAMWCRKDLYNCLTAL